MTTPDYLHLSSEMTVDEMAAALEAVLHCAPDGLPEAGLRKWLDIIDDAAMNLAIVNLVEERRIVFRWDEQKQDLTLWPAA